MNETEFLRELSELTKKYKIVISGCGCCGSPSLNSMTADEENGQYEYQDRLKWEAVKHA